MHSSPILLIGLGALSVKALAYGAVTTVIDTTTTTITSCGPDVENCQGTQSATTSEVTATTTYCPPSASSTVAGILTSLTTPIAAVPDYSILNASSSVANTSMVSIATLSSNISVSAQTSSPTAAPGYSNSTMTSPAISPSETGILTDTGSPSTVTSVVVVAPTTQTPGSGSDSSSTAPSKPTSTNAAGRMVVPAVMVGLLALGACFLA